MIGHKLQGNPLLNRSAHFETSPTVQQQERIEKSLRFVEYNEDDSHEDRLNTCAGAACYLLHICAVPCSLLLGIGDMRMERPRSGI